MRDITIPPKPAPHPCNRGRVIDGAVHDDLVAAGRKVVFAIDLYMSALNAGTAADVRAAIKNMRIQNDRLRDLVKD